MNTLELLKSAREILDQAYVGWTRDDGRGGHCAIGAIEQVLIKNHYKRTYSVTLAEIAAPEAMTLLGKRIDPNVKSVYGAAQRIACVNNLQGKQAILRVFDDVISALEVSELCQRVEAEKTAHPDLDVEQVTA